MTDHVKTLDADTPDYYGSDVSSVSGIPDGFNDISREEAYVGSDTSSATDGLIDGFNDRAIDDHIGPDPEAIMQSIGEGGGGDQGPVGALTDVRDAQTVQTTGAEASPTSTEAPSTASDTADAPEGDEPAADAPEAPADEPVDEPAPALSMDNTKEELQEAARAKGVDDSGTKQEILDRINA